MIDEAAPGELSFLVEQVPFRDEDEPEAGVNQAWDDVDDVGQELRRMAEHVATDGEELADLGRGDGAVGHLDGRLDQAQRERLHAVSEDLEVAALGVVQPVHHRG